MKRSSLIRVGILVALCARLCFCRLQPYLLLFWRKTHHRQIRRRQSPPRLRPRPPLQPTATNTPVGAHFDADRRRCFSHRHHHAGRNRDARPGRPRDDSGAGDRGPVWHRPGCAVRRRRHPARQERQVVRLLLTIEHKSKGGRKLRSPSLFACRRNHWPRKRITSVGRASSLRVTSVIHNRRAISSLRKGISYNWIPLLTCAVSSCRGASKRSEMTEARSVVHSIYMRVSLILFP